MPLMLPGAPQFSRYESDFPATPANPGTAVNHGGVAHTKNTTWTQLIASTAFDAQLVIVTVTNNIVAGGDSCTLLDIGIGAASSESVVIPDLLAGWVVGTTAAGGARHYIFPLYIPAGSRLSARTASVRTSGSVTVGTQLFGGPRDPERWWCGQQVTAYGIDTASSSGTEHTAGNSGAESTAAAIGTTSADHDCIVFGVQGAPATTTMNALAYHFDVGIDAASTSWLAQDAFFFVSTTSEAVGWAGSAHWPLFSKVPSGSELAIGGECSGTAQALDFALYGVS